MKVLMVDIGGTNVKFMNSREGEVLKIPSGSELTPGKMIEVIREMTADWDYEAVSIGFPSILRKGRPVRDPLNLGPGWLNYDFAEAFGKPVRMINDAAMQALGNYVHGRLLFLGFGTSVGACLIADDAVVPIEIGLIKLSRNKRFMDRLSKAALKTDGMELWLEAVHEAVDLMQDVFRPDDTVLGGGNAKLIEKLPDHCRPVANSSAYVGALRLWEDADLFAQADESTWKISRRE